MFFLYSNYTEVRSQWSSLQETNTGSDDILEKINNPLFDYMVA